MRHHLAFRNFRPSVLDAAETLFDQRPWAMSDEDALAVYQNFADAISGIYRVPEVKVENRRHAYRSMAYVPALVETDALTDMPQTVSPPRLQMRRLSILSLFHGIRVHVLAQHGAEPVSETDPHGWSCSLFYAVRPVMFRARAREGRVEGVTAKDTYSDESWQKLIDAGLTFGDTRLTGSKEQWAAAIAGLPIPEMDAPVSSEPSETLTDDDLEAFVSGLSDDDWSDVEEAEREADIRGDVGGEGDPIGQERIDHEEAADAPAGEASDDLPEVATMNRDAVRRLAAEHNVPGRGSLNRDDLAARLVEMGLAR